MILLLALLLAGERTVLGVWDRWGAFRDEDPARCFAIAQPVDTAGRTDRSGAFASVATRVGPARRPAVFIRFAATRSERAPVTLAIGERRFALAGALRSARAPDAATDRAIVGAMRGGRSMSVTTLTASGAAIADTYTLNGAATAIDAAALACARPHG